MVRKRKQPNSCKENHCLLVIYTETEEKYLKALKNKYNIQYLCFDRKKAHGGNKENLPNGHTFQHTASKIEKKGTVYKSIYHVFDMEYIKDKTRLNGVIQHIENCKKKKISIYSEDIPVEALPQLPSIEAWFLLHFKELCATGDVSADCETKLKKHMQKYEKNKTKDWQPILNKTKIAISKYKKTAKIRQTQNQQLIQAGITRPDMQIASFVDDLIHRRI